MDEESEGLIIHVCWNLSLYAAVHSTINEIALTGVPSSDPENSAATLANLLGSVESSNGAEGDGPDADGGHSG